MPDRYLETESSSDSRASRAGPIDTGDSRASPIVSGLMVGAAVAVIILASAM